MLRVGGGGSLHAAPGELLLPSDKLRGFMHS